MNGPLSDTVGFSLSGSFNQRDGYYENLAGGDALGELNRWGVRGQLYFLPSDVLEVRVIADYSDLDEACCGVANLFNGPTGAAIFGLGGALVPNAPFVYEGYYDFTPSQRIRKQRRISAVRLRLQRYGDADVDHVAA